MYYLLDRRYRLRGWERLPFAVVDREAGKAYFVDRKIMDVLELCSGKVDFRLPMISGAMRETAASLAAAGVIHECAPGAPLDEGQRYRLYPNRFMSTVHWSVTGRCNCRCRHCYMSAPDAKFGELPHADVMRIIEEMGACGVLRCSITGGEALVRSDFWDIIDALRAQEIRIVQIYSNGFLVNERLLDGFAARGLFPEFNMSFDGTGTHDWLRGIDGAEKAVRRAFTLCRERGFPTGAEMCLWRDNLPTLRGSVQLLAELGCRALKTTPIADTGAWAEGGCSAAHDLPEEALFQAYLDYLEDFYRDLPPMEVHLGGFFLADGRRPDRYHLPAIHRYSAPLRASLCVHARSHMYISAEGRALTCMALAGMEEAFQARYPLVQEIGLRQALTDSTYMELIDTRAGAVIAHNEKCRVCPHREQCLGGCRASALCAHPGDILAPDETTCRLWRGGWLDRIRAKVRELRPTAVCAELAEE